MTPRLPVTVVSELYYPEQTSTGYFLTRIAEGLARDFDVRVLCSQPTYSARGVRAASEECRNGVRIKRCIGTTFSKDLLMARLVNMATIGLSMFFTGLARIGRGSVGLVVTNPPLLPYLIAIVCKIKRAKCLILVHDVYPDVLIASGLVRRSSGVARLVQLHTNLLYRLASHIIVIGRDMEQLVREEYRIPSEKISLIANWADTEEIKLQPREENGLLKELELEDKFIVEYCGNMGRTHDLELVIAVAEAHRNNVGIHFLLVGWGAKRGWVASRIGREKLENVTLLPHQPRERLCITLNASDLNIIPFVSGMVGVSVPSRMYNVMAAGKPILAVADEASELSMVVREEGIGWVVNPGDVSGVARAVQDASQDKDRLREMGRRARDVAEQKYSFERVIRLYGRLLRECFDAGQLE